MQEQPADPLIGSTLDGRYLVLSKVAHGGMSTVYLANDQRLGRNIALKMLRPHLAADDGFVARLQREAQSAASLSHPHVVQIHDHAAGPDHAYLVFEFIDGYTLRDVIDGNGALSPRQALDLLDPVVEGLAAAHHAGLVHRDVKPENVLISHQGWVKIGDFGLSRAVTTSTNTSTLLGTVGYIAPELAQGQGGDARSDIYSAGIMLYELLTGQQPFRNEMPVAVVMAHIRDDVPAPSLAVPGLPPVMDELVRYMTEKDPDHRPANGAALLEDLRHIRQTLSPGELDFGAPFGKAPLAAPGAARKAVERAGTAILAQGGSFHGELGSAPDHAPAEHHTQAPPFARSAAPTTDEADATSVIAAPRFPTSVLPAGTGLYAEDPHAPGTGPVPVKTSRRRTSAQAKARAREAATPRTTLGPAKPRRRALLWIALVMVLVAAVAAAGWFLALGPGALATVPDVHNKSIPQAQEALLAAGFETVPTAEIFDEKVAAGLVVATDPNAGASVRRFNSILLQVSRGPVLYQVPDLTGKTLPEAQQDLADATLAVGKVSEAFNELVPAGTVISQDPQAGKEFRANSKITLNVSKGPRPIPVPAVTGLTESAAIAALKEAGLVGAIAPEQVNSATVAAGLVLTQSPASGELKAGEKVTLTLSKGPKMIPVPDLVGKQAAAARSELEALGFKVAVENLLGGFFGTVRFQDPQGGSAPEGSTITLRVI
ncbi:PASTA domain-containing protein [Specibacter sp. NPDC057265]|uniref:Stk1 family PASTA domain-containing Ser/Thr kinase n=1 Tax=Specibacter sp. NPDC057265 TaxID=3346075 RepID=UPI003625F7A2